MKNQYLELTNQELVSLFCDGDNEAFAFLFMSWQQELYFYAYHFVKNDEESEDILFDSFEKIIFTPPDYRKKKFIEEGISFKWFLKSVIKNRAIDIIRGKKNKFRILDHLKFFIEKTTLNNAVIKEQELYIAQILKSLESREREMVIMRMHGFSVEEISEKFFVSKKTVSNIIAASKQKLKLTWKKNTSQSHT
jgi:RNA polymerase sigma-70 factor (ECF subfamily)